MPGLGINNGGTMDLLSELIMCSDKAATFAQCRYFPDDESYRLQQFVEDKKDD